MADLLPEAILAAQPDLPVWPAKVTSVTPLEVDRGSGAQRVISLIPSHRHAIGDWVTVMAVGGRLRIIGTSAVRPQIATVLSVAGSLTTVQADDGTILAGLPTVGVVSSGQRVGIMWGSDGGVVVGSVGTTPPPKPPPDAGAVDPDEPPPPAGSPAGRILAAPTIVCTARSGAWRTDGRAGSRAYQGHWTSGSSADNTGYFFYGAGGLKGPSGAVIVPGGPRIRMRRDTAAGVGAARLIRLRLHGAPTRPGTPPAWIGSAVVIGSIAQGGNVEFPIPDAHAALLLSGAAAGVGIDMPGTTDYLAIYGPSEAADSGTITLPYTL